MRIDGRNAILQAYVQKVAGRRAGDSPEDRGMAPASGDAVTLSGRAHDVESVKQHLATLPEVREKLVAEIRGMLERGEYSVSNEAVADRILQSGVLD